MRNIKTDTLYSDPGPEELILDGWLDENEPYLSLRDESVMDRDAGPWPQEPGLGQS